MKKFFIFIVSAADNPALNQAAGGEVSSPWLKSSVLFDFG